MRMTTYYNYESIIMLYTEEQLKYINYNKKKNTKLLACAGSGKTRCIIARINRLLETNMYNSDEILMLTFSRFTKDDFIQKIKLYSAQRIPSTCIKTIDSYAKNILESDKTETIDVSLLSFKLMKLLDKENKKKLKKIKQLKKIKIVFIDEAQDLNEIQYNIFCHMYKKLNILINMVGDPNQNIYQFRKSSDKYLTQFDAKIFTLTKNFRSYLSIVNFSKYLRPFDDYNIICTKGSNNCEPIMMFYEDEKILEDYIVDILKSAMNQNIDLSEFAILSPTRGRMRGCGRSHGLCFISNILYKAKIKFRQFYEESIDELSGESIKYSPIKGHVNILTYMGSKGLEWKYVIIIDADTCLINKTYFSEEKHNHDRYLLYVACSRAIENMYIFSRCYFRNGSPCFRTNQWFRNIPKNYYKIDDRFSQYFSFLELRYCDYTKRDTLINKILDKMDCYDLDNLSELINYESRVIKYKKKIFKQDYSNIENTSAIFLSRYTENLFHALYNIKQKRKHDTYDEIENIINTNKIVTGITDGTAYWYYQNKKNFTWDKFDNAPNIPTNIRHEIDNKFDRNKSFDSHTIAVNGYYQWFILNQIKWISDLYRKYIKCKKSTQIRKLLFYLMIVIHGIKTQHYYHIKTKGKKYINILHDFNDMFVDIENYVETSDHNFVTNKMIIDRWNMVGYIDIVDDREHIWNIKCNTEITLKHTIIAILHTLMHNDKLINDDFNNSNKVIDLDINFINFLKGEEIVYSFSLTSAVIKNIIEILRKNMDHHSN